jgi:hypothetical protein
VGWEGEGVCSVYQSIDHMETSFDILVVSSCMTATLAMTQGP